MRKAGFRTFHGSSNGKETYESMTNPEVNVPISCPWKNNYSYREVCESQRILKKNCSHRVYGTDFLI